MAVWYPHPGLLEATSSPSWNLRCPPLSIVTSMSCVSSDIRGQPFVTSLSLTNSMTNAFLGMVASAHLSLTGGSQQQWQPDPSVSRRQCQDCLWVRAAPPARNSFTCLGCILGGVAGWAGMFVRSARVQGLSHQHGLVGAPGKPGSCGHGTAVSQPHAELQMELLAWPHCRQTPLLAVGTAWVPLSSRGGGAGSWHRQRVGLH